jgi:hypothetical protein
MSFAACSILVAVTLTGTPVGSSSTPVLTAMDVAAVAAPATETKTPELAQSTLRATPAVPEAWMVDRAESRPAALPAMYAALGALNAFDVYSTRRAIGAGATEANPLMRRAAGSSGAMLAVKALSTAGTIYFAERAWKKNRKGAMVLMAAINGVTAAIAMRNVRNAR